MAHLEEIARARQNADSCWFNHWTKSFTEVNFNNLMIALCNKTAMRHSSEPSAWRLVLKIHLQPITLLEEERDNSPGVVVEESMKFQIHDMTPFRILHGLCYRGRCFKDRGSVGKSSVVST